MNKKIFILMGIVAVLIAAAMIVRALIPISPITTYYKFDQSSGTVLPDATGNGNTGTVIVGGGKWEGGLINNALFFDNATTSVNITHAIWNSNITTISFWIAPNSTIANLNSGDQDFIMDSQDPVYSIATQPGAILQIYLGGTKVIELSKSQLNQFWGNSTWIHFFINSSSTGGTWLMINGGQFNFTSTTAWTATNPAFTYFGRYRGSSSLYDYYGRIDEFAVWPIVLNYTDDIDLYNSGGGFQYPFGQGIGSISLNSPANNTQTIDSSILFNASITPSASNNNTNLTLYLWNSSGALIGGSPVSTNLSGNSTNITTWTVATLPVGNITWNTLGCWANSTFTNCTWAPDNYTLQVQRAVEISQVFDNPALAGTQNTYYANFSVSPDYSISAATLNWNGTSYSGTWAYINSTAVQFQKAISMPVVSAQQNVTFNWTITFSDSSTAYSSTNNQILNPYLIDNCGSYTHKILNYTLFDEDKRTLIDPSKTNFTMYLNVLFYPSSSKNSVLFNYSNTYYGNNAQVCSSVDLGSSTYYIDSKVKYSSNNTYTNIEEYNIQDHLLSSAISPMNISLYSLNASNAQMFQVTYNDVTTQPVSEALIQIERYYPELNGGTFITTQAPVTDAFGQATVFLIPSTTTYSILVTSNGNTLSNFNRYTAFCQNPTLNTCTITLNAVSSSSEPTDFSTYGNVSYTLASGSNSFNVTFSTTDGSTRTFQLNGTLLNGANNVSVCSTSISTSTGTLRCSVPSSYTNSTLLLNFYSDGSLVFQKIVNYAAPASTFLGNDGFIFAFLIVLTLPFIFITSTIGMLIAALIGIIAVGAMTFVSGWSLLSVTGAFGWLIVIIFIIIWRISKSSTGS